MNCVGMLYISTRKYIHTFVYACTVGEFVRMKTLAAVYSIIYPVVRSVIRRDPCNGTCSTGVIFYVNLSSKKSSVVVVRSIKKKKK